MSRAAHFITVYDNTTEEFVTEFELPASLLNDLPVLFNRPPNDPMVGGYELDERQRRYFEDLLNKKFDPARLSYYLQCYSMD